ncbi:phosphatase PAP2 family protein [Actinomycetospora endophytica]|uniref:Phosphatase PAP2 family protein n=1 Tax=Actinomycetospora endophytica TaxID=2291215 RepID=A0ABS8P1C1_9PSEU|nr:phosphatase PAP2 family protein [Actinomycetospora endophytica]MCD2192057.1 phosphatase PAP2 family protein [Actinomycetospora endophytica]
MPQWPVHARHTRLVARRLRLPMAGLALLGAVVVTGLGLYFSGDTRAGHTDRAVAGLVRVHRGVARTVELGFADLGNPLPVAAALLLLAAVAFAARGPRGLALALLGPPLAMVTTSLVLKPLIDRTRGGELAFPSGHTTAVASMSVAAGTLLLGWVVVPRVLRWAGAVLLALLAVAVGLSMVGLGAHYPTDTVGGTGVALAVVLVVALAVDAIADRRPGQRIRGRAPDGADIARGRPGTDVSVEQ